MKPKLSLFALALAAVLSVPFSAFGAAPPDNSVYAGLLARHVKDGFVDYKGFKAEEPLLDSYLASLEKVNPDELSRDDQLAFYINLYNAATIKLILTGYPGVTSIKDLGGFWGPWKKKFIRVNGKVLTLGQIEHKILRPRFRDPRVHFAIVCASKGCPPLRSEPYEGSRVGRQLDDVVSRYLNDPAKTYLKDDKLYVTRIFKWFSGDFTPDPISFILRYAKGPFRDAIAAKKGEIRIEYLDYDWSLNGE